MSALPKISPAPSLRAESLASVLERGARALAEFASRLSRADWRRRVPHDGRTFGVVVHHVASMYPLEIEVARRIARGEAVTDVTWDGIHTINAAHAAAHGAITKADALSLLRTNSAAAAAAIRGLSDAELDRATPNSMYADAPLTCQFMLEDHAVRHAFHHLARLRAALDPSPATRP